MILKDKIIVMTGATSGLGTVAAQYALAQGAKLIVLYRNANLLQPLQGKGELIAIQADLSSKKSIKDACITIKNSYDHVDILINNAGLWVFGDRRVTHEGHEMTFMVNVLAPWILIHELAPLLDRSKDPRIINTASALHQGIIQFSDIEFSKNFTGFKAYRQSKLALILLTRHLAKEKSNWTLVSQHPGVVSTSLGREGGWFSNIFFKIFGISPEKGAQTLIFLMESDKQLLKSGSYYTNSKEANTTTPMSRDMNIAEQLALVLERYS
ncbi:MAG TPA: SDR family NAD(P)-dependent oxidoreductase [Saprospiraceae bacterium]|nr:SDR family NAD(P)-dependent oxidoreductase [Saprospiraceae bacterium]